MQKIEAYAKINLYLDIEKKREDGYHDIVSVMQTIDWNDTVSVSLIENPGIFLTCSDERIPTDRRNTAYKAAQRYLEKTQYTKGVAIHIDKRIPHEAGMAGGSADAAATLIGLDSLFNRAIEWNDLLEIGKSIGADVPFCMTGGTSLVTGIGEKMDRFPTMPDCFLVCAKLGNGVSTPNAYSELDKKYCDFRNYKNHGSQLEFLKTAFEARCISDVSKGLFNVFEEVVTHSHPSVSELKKVMAESEAIATMMSGSGPSVFGIFESQVQSERAAERISSMGAECRICRPIGSPYFNSLTQEEENA